MIKKFTKSALVAVLALSFGLGGTAFAVDTDGEGAVPSANIAAKEGSGEGGLPEGDPSSPIKAEGSDDLDAKDTPTPVNPDAAESSSADQPDADRSDSEESPAFGVFAADGEFTGTIMEPVSGEPCTVTIPVETTGEGNFSLTIYDRTDPLDTAIVAEVSWYMAGDGEHEVEWFLDPADMDPKEIYFSLEEDEGSTVLDTYDFLAYQTVAGECSAAFPINLALIGYDPSLGARVGDEFVLEGSGFDPNETVEVLFVYATPVGFAASTSMYPNNWYFETDADGKFSGEISVPIGTQAGLYDVYATGEVSELQGSLYGGVIVNPPTGSIGDHTYEGCTISIPIDTIGSGEFLFFALDETTGDDDPLLHAESWEMGEDGSHTVSWSIEKPAGLTDMGVSFVLWDASQFGEEGAVELDKVGTVIRADLANECSAAVPITIELPNYDPAKGTHAGAVLDIEISGFLSEEALVIQLGPDDRNLVFVDADLLGDYSGTITIPADAKPGEYMIYVNGFDSGRDGMTTVKVVEKAEPVPPKPSPSKPHLAATGSNGVETMLLMGAGLLALGAGGVGLRRFRR